MSERIEYRTMQAGADLVVEPGKAKAGGRRVLRGYAAKFDSLSQDVGGFTEVIRPGAFRDTLRKGDARGLWNHESKYVLGRVSAGTLKLWEDAVGLAFSLVPPQTAWAIDLLTSVARRDITGCSFAFTVDPNGDSWSRSNGKPVRELLSVTLAEISVVSWPAYLETEVNVREELNPEVLAELNRRRVRLEQLIRIP